MWGSSIMIRVQEIGTEREFPGLGHIWDDVLARSGVSNVFFQGLGSSPIPPAALGILVVALEGS
jgi:hypothetical protein